jgi:hypothetical protein
MQNTELQNILTESIKDRNRLVKRLHYWQNKGNDAKCDHIIWQLGCVNDNIEFCKDRLQEDPECNPRDFPGMTPEELKLYEAAE